MNRERAVAVVTEHLDAVAEALSGGGSPDPALGDKLDAVVAALHDVLDKLDRVQGAASLGSFVAIYFGYLQRGEPPPEGMQDYIEQQTGLSL